MTTATATPTRPTTTATTTAPRACWWVIRPEEMPDGRLFGALAVRMGRLRPDFYRVVRDDSDEFGSDWSVAKEQADGTFAEPYTVHLPPGGPADAADVFVPGTPVPAGRRRGLSARRRFDCRDEESLI